MDTQLSFHFPFYLLLKLTGNCELEVVVIIKSEQVIIGNEFTKSDGIVVTSALVNIKSVNCVIQHVCQTITQPHTKWWNETHIQAGTD
jgi:hypothetical protein